MSFELINDDCLHYMKGMTDNIIDLVVTSTPYNCGIDYDVYNDNRELSEYISKKRLDDLYSQSYLF